MGQVTQQTIDMWNAQLDRNEMPQFTNNEFRQLCYAWGRLQRMKAYPPPDRARQAQIDTLEAAAKVCEKRCVGDHNREDAEASACAAARGGHTRIRAR